MAVTFSISNKSDFSQDDFRAAKQAIFVENQNLTQSVPPQDPLPCSNDDEVKASYIFLLERALNNSHIKNIMDAKTRAIVTRFSDEELKQIYASLIDQVNSGVTSAEIIQKLESDAGAAKAAESSPPDVVTP